MQRLSTREPATWTRGPAPTHALDLPAIVARAVTLRERLRSGSEPVATVLGADVGAQLSRWVRATGGDVETLERRLAWDGRTLDGALAAIAATPAAAAWPGWAETVAEISDAARAIGAIGWPAPVPPPLSAAEPLPYESLLVPAVLVARARLGARLASSADPLTLEAHRDLERALLERLCNVAARAVHEHFEQSLSVGRRLQRTLGHVSTDSRELHDRFVGTLLMAGLAPLFEQYSVLARLVATVVEQHVAACAELAQRIASDHDHLAQTFAPDGRLGLVTSVRAHLSDFHNGGRSVAILTFEGGARVVYKPKSLALDVAFSYLQAWANARGATPALTSPGVLDRGTYGWVACAEHAPCVDEAAAVRFHQRAGMLMALVHALCGSDCHRGNLIAAGEHPVLVDLETLMHHEARAMGDEEPLTDAMQTVVTRFRDSILRTGFVPRWDFSGEGSAFDVSGLGGGAGATRTQELCWRDVGTDAMHLEMADVVSSFDDCTPMLDGRPLSAGDYVDALAAGFERTYGVLIAHRADLLADDGPIAAFRGCPVRFIFRPTIVYSLLRDQALAPEALTSGVSRSIVLESLARGFMGGGDRPDAWPILAAELEAMERLDVPHFVGASDSDALPIGETTAIAHYFERPSYHASRAKVAAMDAADLGRQVDVLRLAFVARSARAELGSVTLGDGAVVAPVAATDDALIAGAARIADEIAERAVRGRDGSAAWLDIGYTRRADRFQLQPMGIDLYDGATGIGLFLAAYERATGDDRHHALALGAMAQARRPGRYLERMDIGGISGIGSVIYALVRVARFIKEPSLLDDALRMSGLIDVDAIAADRHLDVMSGTAGALLGLLALHQAFGNAAVLERARVCGRHLVANCHPERSEGSARGARGSWKTLDGRQLAGFSHGASGIAHALLQLHAITGDEDLRRAAEEGLAFERHVFSADAGAWPDLRADGAARYESSWCNGAAGIALARAAVAPMIDVSHIRDDIELGTSAVIAAGWDGVDHLCCGNVGRIEALLVASHRFSRPGWRAAALAGAAQVMARRNASGGFRLFQNQPEFVYSPGFFRGAAGIGYGMLRLARPAVLPSVLLLE